MSQGIPVNQVNGGGGANNMVQSNVGQPINRQMQLQPVNQQTTVQQQHLQQQQQVPLQNNRQLTPQQLQRQRHQLLFQRLKNHKFAETTEDILAKYANMLPSLEFHIYDNHFRFGQQDGVIPKSSPLAKEFIRHILREEIPDSLVEVIRDSGIQLYEGCVILNMVDHRDLVDKVVKTESEEKIVKTAKSYRTVLKPVQLSIYADLLCQADSLQLRLSDQSSLLLELEILTLTKRNVDLSVPLNPYKCNDYLRPEHDSAKYDPEEDTVVYKHRVNNEMHKYRPLHEDSVANHQNHNEYEQIMSLFSENTNANATAMNMMSETASSKSSQFLRLRFIENYRRKLEKMKLAGMATGLQNKVSGEFSNGINGSIGLGSISSMLGLTPQQRTMIQQQRIIQQQQKRQMSSALNDSRANSSNGNNNTNNNGTGTKSLTPTPLLNEKKKTLTKRPRKQPTKKQQLALLLALALAGINLNDSGASTPDTSDQPPKKKRGTYKKKQKNADQGNKQQQQPDQQTQQQPQQQIPNNIMDMNFNIMGNFPQ